MIANLIAFAWGLAEATLFFIVPDVALSVIALKSANLGWVACLYALAGAMTGGAIMFYWGRANIEKVARILDMIPAIRPKDLEKVRTDLQKSGVKTVLLGPLVGIPYKIYASYAHLTTTIYCFLLISIPARIVRFVLVVFITPVIINKFLPEASYTIQVQSVLILWGILYAIYFIVKRR